jgi:hypothetical protein
MNYLFFTAISESIMSHFYTFLSMNQLYFRYKRCLIIHDSNTVVQYCICYGTNRYGTLSLLYFGYKRCLIIHDSSTGTVVQYCICYGTNRYGTLSKNPLIHSYFLHLQCFFQGCGSGSALTMVDWIRISSGNADPDPEEQK